MKKGLTAAIGREALVILGATILAAAIISQFPGVKAWIREQWR